MKLTDAEFESILSEHEQHKKLPTGHPNCIFCDFASDVLKTTYGQAMAEDSGSSSHLLDNLFYLYCGIRIGRNQGVQDLVSDLEEEYGKENEK